MSGFDRDWLALREPADRDARDAGLIEALAAHLARRPARLIDIGCGTGAMWRALAGHVPPGTRFTLIDHDPRLLEEAARLAGPESGVDFLRHDLNDIDALPLDGVVALTASAFFDLASEGFCRRLVARLAAACAFYAALSYDGRVEWSVRHPLDRRAVDGFNRHQRTDKGLGPALGPEATACLQRLFAAAGYRVRIASSPWRLTARDAALQKPFLDGFSGPLRETAALTPAEIEGWLAFRHATISRPDSSCLVGHLDILALPP